MTESRRQLVAIITFVALGMPFAAFSVAWPTVAEEMNLTLGTYGTLLLPGSVGYGLVTLLGAGLVRRFGVGRLIATCAWMVAGVWATYTVAGNFTHLVLLATVAGIAGGGLDVGLNSFAALEMTPRAMNMLHAGFGVGAASGPAILTASLAWAGGWRPGMLVVVGLVAAIATVLTATRDWWTIAQRPDEPQDRSVKGRGLSLPVFLVMGLFFLYAGVELGTGNWAYTLLHEGRQVSAALAGGAVTMFWLALTASRSLLGWLGDRFEVQDVLKASVWGSLGSLVLMWWAPAPWIGILGLLGAGFMLGPIFPLQMSLVPIRFGRGLAPRIVGLQVFAANAGVLSIPWIMGRTVDRIGIETIGAVVTVAAVLLLVCDLALRHYSGEKVIRTAT